MSSLKRLLCCSLILATAILVHSSRNAHGQTSDAKPKLTGSISGHVTIGGKAAPGITVAAFGGDTINRRVAAAQSVTDGEGYYRLSGLAPAQYQIGPLTPNLTTAEPGSFGGYGFVQLGSSKNVFLAANEDADNIDLKLVRGGVITGRITDSENKPVVEERVSLQFVDENGNPPRTAPAILPYNGQMYQTDDRGMYRIYGLPAGHYKVSVGADTARGVVTYSRRRYFPQMFYPDATDQSKATVLELAEGGEVANIDIKVGSAADTFSVTGLVVDSETGLPISGARIGFMVAVKDPNRMSSTFSGVASDARGEFKLDGFGPGRYGAYLTSDYEGGEFYSDPVYFDVVDKDVSGVEVKAVHGLSLSGIVESEGLPKKDSAAQLSGLRVSVNVISGDINRVNALTPRSGGSATVMPDGSFQVNGLRPGHVSIGVSASGPNVTRPSIMRIEHDGVGITQGFEIQPGQSISGLRIVVNYGTGTIRGTVRFEGGSLPIDSRTFVSCKREGARDGSGAQLDSRGHFVINGLAPGTYEVTLQLVPPPNPGRPQRPNPPQKQFVNVTNDAESEVTFIVDLRPKEEAP